MAAENFSLGLCSAHWKNAEATPAGWGNERPRRVSFMAGRSQKSLGVRSGEYETSETT